jgi:hypothetical protein
MQDMMLLVIWCIASTLKMMKLNWSKVTIFKNHDCNKYA